MYSFCPQEPILHHAHWQYPFYKYKQFPNLKQEGLFLLHCESAGTLLHIILTSGPRLLTHSLSEQMESQNTAVVSFGWKQMMLFLIFHYQSKTQDPPYYYFMGGRKLKIFVDQIYILVYISTSHTLICFQKELFKFIMTIWVIAGWWEKSEWLLHISVLGE